MVGTGHPTLVSLKARWGRTPGAEWPSPIPPGPIDSGQLLGEFQTMAPDRAGLGNW
jgi:hypothetical protein